jgi:hypothetical protein
MRRGRQHGVGMAAGDAHRVALTELFNHTGGFAVKGSDLNRGFKTRFSLLKQHHHIRSVMLNESGVGLERHG